MFDSLLYPNDLSGKVLYMYFDESGDLDFSTTGSKYFILTCMITTRPFQCADALRELKHSLITVLDRFKLDALSSIVAITDRLPNEVRKKNYEHQMRLMLSKRLKARFTIAHHRSCSDMNLQIADYLSWAIQRKMEHDDAHWLRRIERTMLSSIEYHEVSI